MKILIAGGGIGGLTAALCLARNGHEVEILEQAPDMTEVGAGIQLSPNCTRVLHDLGLKVALDACAFLPEGTEFRDWKSGQVISSSPLGQSALTRFGYPYYHIHRGDLLNVLVEAAEKTAEITLRTNTKVTGYGDDESGLSVQIGSAEVTGDGLIGADGIHSTIRSFLWGVAKPVFTGHVAWRALIPASQLPAGLVRPVSSVWWGPNKHFVSYYVRQGTLVNCVCVVEKKGWEVESWTEHGDPAELKADFAGWHDDIQVLIDHIAGDRLFKWALFDRSPMSQWGRGAVTLLGDACHPTLPFMAQGAAMAIEDSAVLAACLQQDREVSVNLRQYENLRRHRTAKIQQGSRRNAAVFHMTGVKAWARNRVAGFAGQKTMNSLYDYNALDIATH